MTDSNTTPLLDVDVGTFTAKQSHEKDALHLLFTGEADTAALHVIESFLQGAHALAESRGAKEVVLDLRKVNFMSSSCFTKLIGWVTRVRDTPEESRYRIRIQSNQASLWQRRSLHALQCFATELITIES